MKPSSTTNSRKAQAIAGVIILGGLIPAASVTLGMMGLTGNYGLGIGLGLACAAYTLHSFMLYPRARTPGRILALGLSLMLALLYPLWIIPMDSLASLLTVRFEPRYTGQFNGFNFVQLIVTHMMCGTVMALALWASTRSWRVLLTVLIASILCGALAFHTLGFSAVAWNLALAISLYGWARRSAIPDPPATPQCQTCGYSLVGLPTNCCPECGTDATPTTTLPRPVPPTQTNSGGGG